MKKINFLALFVFTLAFIFSATIGTVNLAGAKTKISSGMVIKGKGLSTVYYLGEDNKRYVFPNAKTYFSWYDDFSGVEEIDDADLADYPLGGNIRYRPGNVLVKIQTDPKVYAVSHNGQLRWVKTEALAKAIYGDNWNSLIDDIPDSFFTNYEVDDPIEDEDEYDPEDEEEKVSNININLGLKIRNRLQARIEKAEERLCNRLEKLVNRLQKRLNRFGLKVPSLGSDFLGLCVADDDDDNTSLPPFGKKVTICHIPPGDADSAHTITVSKSAVHAHLSHGDTLGACAGDGNDTTAPVISNVNVAVATSTAVITWDTNEDSDSRVDYDTVSINNETSADSETDSTKVTEHSITLDGLTPSTTYYYIIKSTDASGNEATTTEATFKTLDEKIEADTTAPIISNIVASPTATTTIITWSTDENSDSRVEYATEHLDTASPVEEESDSSPVTSHLIKLTGLATSTPYFYMVESKDLGNNVATSAELSFTTLSE